MEFPDNLIAIVEDDVFLRRALERILHARGYRTIGFGSAEAFLQRAHDHCIDGSIDCVIVDVALPGISGLALYSRLAEQPDAPPVVVVTGFSTPYIQATAKSLGAVDCLAKPFDAVMLLSAIERAIIIRRLRQPAFASPAKS